MQPSARQAELERIYQARKGSRGHVPQISISDDNHHVTEAIGSYYDDEHSSSTNNQPPQRPDSRPLSFMPSPNEIYESRGNKRGGGYFDAKGASSPQAQAQSRMPMERTRSGERVPPHSPSESGSLSPKSVKSMKRMGSVESNHGGGAAGGQPSPPPLSRQSSRETAVQQFPLNDIDYESSPAAVAQELSNLQAIRRMSMNVDTGDPDLAGFGGVVPTVAPNHSEDEEMDAARLFWVPARLHPELAPKEFKTFIEDRVDKIRRKSGDSDTLSVESLERSGSGASSLRRKKSMLSNQIDTRTGNYEDGAERLERKKSKRMQVEGQTTVANLEELERLVDDPAQLVRRMSLDYARRSQDSVIEVPPSEDMPILPAGGQQLKRSTRTTYRKGSLRKGERVPFSKRVEQRRQTESEDDAAPPSPVVAGADEREPILGLTRVQTEPTPPPSASERGDDYSNARTTSGARSRRPGLGASQSTDNLVGAEPARQSLESGRSPPPSSQGLPSQQQVEEERQPQPQLQQQQSRGPQPRQFHSRLASGPGRTTAQLPGYNNTNPLPHIIETLPDGTKVPVGQLATQPYPERKSSHDLPRPMHRGGAHMRPVPGRQQASPSSTLDDISSNPSPLPGSGSTRTDALTVVPTFDDNSKLQKKDSTRKSSWKWILGNDDDDREKEKKASKEEKGQDPPRTASKLKKNSQDKARLDMLQNTIDGTTPARGRESLVLNRADVQLEDERKKESKKASEKDSKKEKEKDSGLLSAIFGGKKKFSDSDLKDKKRKSDRGLSPEPPPRILKPDIDYNWTRFSILEERAIYRMAHIKLANPRRALYSQVLLSNFMYSYLAKVQMMHPQMSIPASQQQKAAQQRKEEQQQPAEYSQYQRWQEQQAREQQSNGGGRHSPEMGGGAAQQRANYDHHNYQQHQHQRSSYDGDEQGYDQRSSEEYDHTNPNYTNNGGGQSLSYSNQYSREAAQARVNGIMGAPVGASPQAQAGPGYSVASTRDYLGYPKDQQPFSSGQDGGLWDGEKEEELW